MRSRATLRQRSATCASATGAVLAASENRPVRGDGMLGAAGGIRYERPFVERHVSNAAGRGASGAVRHVGRSPRAAGAGERAVGAAADASPVASCVSTRRVRAIGACAPRSSRRRTSESRRDAWLLVDGEDPADARWAIVLSLMFLGFVGWNVAATARILRKVKA